MTDIDQLARGFDALLRAEGDDFAGLATAAGLDPANDFRNADLSGLDLRGEDLRAFDLRNARLRGALIEGTRFNRSISADQLAEAIPRGDGPPVGPPAEIAIVAIGARAREIARHLAAPDWLPVDGNPITPSPAYVLTDDPDLGAPEGCTAIYVAADGMMPLNRQFRVTLVIADDQVGGDIATSESGAPYPNLEGPGIRLLAPALPTDRPSDLLLARRHTQRFHAIVDTSVARSPFWSGNRWRALDRRIADTVVGIAMLAASDGELANSLTAPKGDEFVPLVTFGFAPVSAESGDRQETGYPLSSEAAGLAGGESDKSTLWNGQFEARWIRQRPTDAGVGIAQLRRRDPQGDSAFHHVAAADAYQDSGGPEPLTAAPIPSELRERLKFPKHAFGASVGPNGQPVAVVAETPDIGMVAVASREGWKVARYTDRRFIAEALKGEGLGGRHQLPDELLLPELRPRAANRGLATRGVDPRDVVPIDPATLGEFRRSSTALLDSLRPFRASFDRDFASEGGWLVQAADVAGWLSQDRALSPELETFLQAARATKSKTLKRPADLRVAWRWPSAPATRFIVADGPIPIRLGALELDAAPAQSLFIIDGDEAVPALLQSPVFEVWARATTTRSTSWMSRFSVGRTFETFPVLPPFRLVETPGSGVHLTLVTDDDALARLARDWLGEVRQGADIARDPMEESHGKRQDIRADLDAAILRSYGLAEDADDLAILERLLSIGVA